jgi:tetratricopeptide (TPR) repeat protein
LLGLAGCTSTGKPRATAEPPPRDAVLWQCRQGTSALREGRFEDAIRSFDDALTTINAVRARDPDARRARGYFSPESAKTFLGEPYERVMAFYYRGILYWMQGELDNARACFRSAQFHDADAENREYASDYVLLDFLDGLATEKLGGDGSDAFKRAQGLLRRGTLPAATRDDNVIIFAEYGRGPVKYATGAYGEQLRFRPGNSVAHAAVLKLAGRELRLDPLDDLHFQATTRGGRVMDHILANKAVFKAATDTAGDVAMISGAILASDRDTAEAGWALLMLGFLSKIVSAGTVPAAASPRCGCRRASIPAPSNSSTPRADRCRH